ncbi:hypothetical protein [Nocardiopsis suaedae]|uniref:Uncharacterized protein n=1 Tax=Nocardiopsis suaedae TaxID=3018444 RepID=A0ABT4TW91_9ACTN|nr:hypothetical protein [Nocardiopsis suaedae]MDA2808960.1 hypothetical protein [Nocardiopsis suaedae]
MGARLTGLFTQTPEIALFTALAAGYAVGRIPFGTIRPGGIRGTLLAALVILAAGHPRCWSGGTC